MEVFMTVFKPIHAVALFLLFCLFGCGGGGSGDSDNPTDGFAFNEQGFPVVSGTYSMRYSKIDYSCNTGETGQTNYPVRTADVNQNVNVLDIESENILPESASLLSTSGTNGFVERNAGFFTTHIYSVSIQNVSGIVEFTQNRSGQFTPTGWSGDIETTAIIGDAGVVCTYTGTFSGEKSISRYDDDMIKEDNEPQISLMDFLSNHLQKTIN
jgi:hypothetical protein